MLNKKNKNLSIIPDERIVGKIYYIRGEKVMFDRDLAELYGVEVRALNQAVKRNKKRFPNDFMFQLNKKEFEILRFHFGTSSDESSGSQIVTSDKNLKSQNVISSWGGARTLPFVFTEQGVAMLSSVLNSNRAIEVNIQIMRTFTKMRKLLASNKELREKIEKMESKYDKNFKIIFKVLAKLMKTDNKSEEIKIIGFEDKK